MPTVYLSDYDIECEAEEGHTILDVARENNIALHCECGGFCNCCTCHVVIVDGLDNTSSPTDDEDDMLDALEDSRDEGSRLSCQAEIYGDVVVEIPPLPDFL